MQGTIIGLRASWGTGVALVAIRTQDGRTEIWRANNAPFIQALDDTIPGGCVKSNHTDDFAAVIRTGILFETDPSGVISGIGPVSQVEEALS